MFMSSFEDFFYFQRTFYYFKHLKDLSPLKPGLDCCVTARQGKYVSVCHSKTVACYMSINVTFWLGDTQTSKHRKHRWINQSTRRMNISVQHLVEIWEVYTLARLQPSATYIYPSMPSQNRYVLTSTHNCGQV